jgi:hypothetical protein
MQADFDVADFDGSKQKQLDEQLLVRFFYKTRPDAVETKRQGRPIFKEVEYIDIKVPGDRGTGVCRPARAKDRQRFPRHYAAFKNRVEAPTVGTPLSEWARIPRSAVEQLAFANVKTDEQLATLADSYAGQIQGGNNYKKMAKDYLEEVKNNKSDKEIDILKKQNKELLRRLKALEAKPKKKRKPLTEEQKAKMAEGRKRAAAKKKAAKSD